MVEGRSPTSLSAMGATPNASLDHWARIVQLHFVVQMLSILGAEMEAASRELAESDAGGDVGLGGSEYAWDVEHIHCKGEGVYAQNGDDGSRGRDAPVTWRDMWAAQHGSF